MISKQKFQDLIRGVFTQDYNHPPHDDLRKCYICEESDSNVPKWVPQLGWENLIEHYEEHFRIQYLQSLELHSKMTQLSLYLPWEKDYDRQHKVFNKELQNFMRAGKFMRIKQIWEAEMKKVRAKALRYVSNNDDTDSSDDTDESYIQSGSSSGMSDTEPLQELASDEISGFGQLLKTKDERYHENIKNAPLTCVQGGPYCTTFSGQVEASKHFKLYHSEKYRAEECPRCLMRFLTRDEMKEHKHTVICQVAPKRKKKKSSKKKSASPTHIKRVVISDSSDDELMEVLHQSKVHVKERVTDPIMKKKRSDKRRPMKEPDIVILSSPEIRGSRSGQINAGVADYSDDDIPLDQNEAIRFTFQESNFADQLGDDFDYGCFVANGFARPSNDYKNCIFCGKDFHCEFDGNTRKYEERFSSHMTHCLNTVPFEI